MFGSFLGMLSITLVTMFLGAVYGLSFLQSSYVSVIFALVMLQDEAT